MVFKRYFFDDWLRKLKLGPEASSSIMAAKSLKLVDISPSSGEMDELSERNLRLE